MKIQREELLVFFTQISDFTISTIYKNMQISVQTNVKLLFLMEVIFHTNISDCTATWASINS